MYPYWQTFTFIHVNAHRFIYFNAVFLCVCFLTYPPSDNSFSEISGLEHCCMLTHLNLGHNKISQISGLNSLPLTHLCLVGPPAICSAMCTFIRALTQYVLLEIFHAMYFTSCTDILFTRSCLPRPFSSCLCFGYIFIFCKILASCLRITIWSSSSVLSFSSASSLSAQSLVPVFDLGPAAGV